MFVDSHRGQGSCFGSPADADAEAADDAMAVMLLVFAFVAGIFVVILGWF